MWKKWWDRRSRRKSAPLHVDSVEVVGGSGLSAVVGVGGADILDGVVAVVPLQCPQTATWPPQPSEGTGSLLRVALLAAAVVEAGVSPAGLMLQSPILLSTTAQVEAGAAAGEGGAPVGVTVKQLSDPHGTRPLPGAVLTG